MFFTQRELSVQLKYVCIERHIYPLTCLIVVDKKTSQRPVDNSPG